MQSKEMYALCKEIFFKDQVLFMWENAVFFQIYRGSQT